MTSDSIDVDLRGEHAGVVTRTPAGAQWSTAPDALAAHGIGSTVLSLGLPLDSSPASVEATEAFFGGLLPEGPRLEALLRDTPDASRDNLVSLLYAAGRDVAGGIVLPGPPITALGPLLTEDEAALEVANPRGYLAGGGSGMSGMQPKVAMARSLEGWHAARDGHPSSHIIKPCAPDAIRPAHAEVWVMRLARRVGLTGHEVSLEWFGDIPAVVIERFDREPAPPGGLARLHQEDAAQALGLPWGTDAKFEWAGAGASLRGIARLLDHERTIHTRGVSEREHLLAQTVFRLLIGDTDGHAKNHSLLHDEQGGVTLAPLYDATPLVLYGGGGEAVALFVAGQRSMRTIDADALVHEASSWGLDVTVARDVVMRTAEATQAAATAVEPDESIADHLPGYVTQTCDALRNGRPVSLGLGEFPLLRPIDVA